MNILATLNVLTQVGRETRLRVSARHRHPAGCRVHERGVERALIHARSEGRSGRELLPPSMGDSVAPLNVSGMSFEVRRREPARHCVSVSLTIRPPCSQHLDIEARAASLADVTVNDISQRYKMQEELGAGAQATVYKGLNRKNNQKVAIKVTRTPPSLRTACGCGTPLHASFSLSKPG